MVLAFHTPDALVNYFRKPGFAGVLGPGTPAGATISQPRTGLGINLSYLLRPFLGFAVVVAWCRWLDRTGRYSRWKTVAYTIAVAIAILLTYATYNYNRGAFVAPIVAVLAVYGSTVRRLRPLALLAMGLVAFFLLTAYQAFRTSTVSLNQALGGKSGTILKRTNLNKEVQTYGGAPQFTGYLLQETEYARHLELGKSLVSSAMSPVPIVGKPFRSSSGTAIYNRLIYGDLGTIDQVIPFQGELFINFNVPGVLVGYVLLGIAVGRMQRRFASALTSVERFAWQYAATWVAFLIIGSVSVVSQIFIYFFWPVYALAFLARGRSHGAPAAVRARRATMGAVTSPAGAGRPPG